MTNLINKITKNVLVPLAFAGSFCGCNLDYSEQEQSEILYEGGKVITTLYNKKHTNSSLNVGMTMKGDLAITPTSVTFPETWGVVFRCEHKNKFPVQGSNDEYKNLWERLDEGDSVRISYKEEYKVF